MRDILWSKWLREWVTVSKWLDDTTNEWMHAWMNEWLSDHHCHHHHYHHHHHYYYKDNICEILRQYYCENSTSNELSIIVITWIGILVRYHDDTCYTCYQSIIQAAHSIVRTCMPTLLMIDSYDVYSTPTNMSSIDHAYTTLYRSIMGTCMTSITYACMLSC